MANYRLSQHNKMAELYRVVWPWLTKWALSPSGIFSAPQLSLASLDSLLLGFWCPGVGMALNRESSSTISLLSPFSGLFIKLKPISHFVCGVCLVPVIWAVCASAPGLTVPGALCPATHSSPGPTPSVCPFPSLPGIIFPNPDAILWSSIPGSVSLCTCPSHYRHEHSWLTLMNKHNASA